MQSKGLVEELGGETGKAFSDVQRTASIMEPICKSYSKSGVPFLIVMSVFIKRAAVVHTY